MTPPRPIGFRVILLSCFLCFCFSLLLFQFHRIQLVQGEKWSQTALRQHYLTVEVPFLRGSFFSNSAIKKNHPEPSQRLVVEIQKFHLYADALSIPERYRHEIAKELIRILGQVLKEEAPDTNLFAEKMAGKGRARSLARWLDPETQEAVLRWWKPFARSHKIAQNALFFVDDYQRSYPYGAMLGQVLHTVRRHRDTETHQAIPTGGLELQFHKFLSGSTGTKRLMRSPKNRLETGELLVPPVHGANIYLTINHCLQAIVEEELEIGVQAAKAKGGWAAMMQPFTGEILALAHYPFFDPSHYETYFNDPEKLEHTKIRAAVDAKEPGSILKPLTLAVALRANAVLEARGEEPIFDPIEPMACSNGSFPGRKPMRDGRLHKYLNMYQALQLSANIYMARLAERIVDRLGAEWYREQLSEIFGLGKASGIEVPGESRGVLPQPGKILPNGRLEWSTPTPFSLAIGYNLQTTTMQILRAYAVLANGGFLVSPTLTSKIVKEGKELPRNTPEVRQVLSSEICDEVVKAMKFVTKQRGSGRRAAVGGYTEAGKSGTSRKIINGQYSKKHHNASFCGFLPVSDPAFVLVVALDEPEAGYLPGVGHMENGGVCAAPIFREISRRSLQYLGIPPDDPHGYSPLDPRFDKEKADWIKEIEQMTEMYAEWNDEP